MTMHPNEQAIRDRVSTRVKASAVTTQLMFQGKAEEAMNLYVSLFGGSVTRIERYGPGGPGAEGSVMRAEFTLAGHRLACIDSPVQHAFTFTPSASLFVDCQDEADLDAAFAKLSEGGAVLMPPGNYGFSRKFTWLNDRFGVSWQLNLP
jgi:predicted 3-demethylubiquinone-9 3-methyltransferase (glyoxalase superfamily)